LLVVGLALVLALVLVLLVLVLVVQSMSVAAMQRSNGAERRTCQRWMNVLLLLSTRLRSSQGGDRTAVPAITPHTQQWL
jgi:hypothetical protein